MVLFRKRHPPVGARPGTLMINRDLPKPKLKVITYDAKEVTEIEPEDLEELRSLVEKPTVTWIDVQGLGDENIIRGLGELFQIHPLAMEDVVNIPQRPKAETYEKHLFFVTRMVRETDPKEIVREQLSIFVGDNYVLTFQERPGDVFDPVRRRIHAGKGPIRKMGADYLGYALIDAALDGYFPVMETLGERLENIEDEIVENPSKRLQTEIYQLRRELAVLKRSLWPQRDALREILREDNDPFFSSEVRVYLRDCYDHCIQMMDVMDSYRETATSLLDFYLSSLGHRTNEVMKVLTIMASIFIPLTFIAGLYGMNFDSMPELHARLGYPLTLAAMALIAFLMILYFRRKGWMGGEGEREHTPNNEEPQGRGGT